MILSYNYVYNFISFCNFATFILFDRDSIKFFMLKHKSGKSSIPNSNKTITFARIIDRKTTHISFEPQPQTSSLGNVHQ